MDNLTVVLNTGSVSYDQAESSVPIADLIGNLTEAQNDGATHVVLTSGNHRGAKWMSVDTEVEWP